MQPLLAQLTLTLTSKDEASFNDFYAGRNQEILTALKETASGMGERMIYLCGVQGVGRSHLLQACCHEAHEKNLTSVLLPMSNLVSLSSEVLDGLETLSLVCIDDIEAIAGKAEWEEAIFNLYNRIYDAGGRIIISAHDLPKATNITLPDLVSRLSFGVIYQLHPLNDDEKLAALSQRANKRGMHLPEEVGKYILTRCPRGLGALFLVLDTLDQASLAAQRRLTLPFVKEILQTQVSEKEVD